MSIRNNFEKPHPKDINQDSPANNMVGTPPPAPQQQSLMSFSAPTEFVDLPSKGSFYSQGHPLHGVDSLEIKFMTAKEEDILTSQALLKKNLTIDRFLNSILVNKSINPSDLLVTDKNAIIIAARITGYGEQYTTGVKCPSCSVSSKVNIDLSNVLETGLHEVEVDEEDAKLTENGTYIVETPRTGASVEIKLLDGHDEKRLTKVLDQRRKNNLPESIATTTMASFIVSVNGSTDPHYIGSFIENAPAADARYVREAFKSLTPGNDLSFSFECPECGHGEKMEVPLNAEFFWPK